MFCTEHTDLDFIKLITKASVLTCPGYCAARSTCLMFVGKSKVFEMEQILPTQPTTQMKIFHTPKMQSKVISN